MFQIQRYDPVKEARNAAAAKKKAKKRKRSNDAKVSSQSEATTTTNDNEAKNAIHNDLVIAPEAQAPRLKKPSQSAISNEAFDDLDVDVNDIIEEQQQHQHVRRDESTTTQSIDSVKDNHVQYALEMSKVPILEAAKAWNMAPFLIDNLTKNTTFEHFFPIQAFAIPNVITSRQLVRARDVCIAAPTGSGKTLAYILPILNALVDRSIRRLRALIVLPSQDLALQVYNVCKQYIAGSDLKVGLAVGQSSFKAEQIALTIGDNLSAAEAARRRLQFDRGNVGLTLKAFHPLFGSNSDNTDEDRVHPDAIDILVCTPGRLMEHMERTKNFTLQHLQFLVVDEADRLLGQTYSNWIERVLDSANSASMKKWGDILQGNNASELKLSRDKTSLLLDPITWRRGGLSRDEDGAFSTNTACLSIAGSVCQPVQLRKFLVSATMTRDPQKLASLHLVNPIYLDIHALGTESKSYSMPASLQEYTIECTDKQKPLVLMSILLEQMNQQSTGKNDKLVTVIFTSSLVSTHRLTRLLQLVWMTSRVDGDDDYKSIAEFSSALNRKERAKLLDRCADANDILSIIVCSDGMSRGMDIESATTVINYDLPNLAKTYVHRCGRTARAGRQGKAITIIKASEGMQKYHDLRKLVQDPDRVKSWTVQKSLIKNSILPHYKESVVKLKELLRQEDKGRIKPSERIPPDFTKQEDGSDSDNDDSSAE